MYLQGERHVDSPPRMRQVCVCWCVCVCACVCVQAGVLAEGVLKRLTSRAARINCVNRTIYNIYTQHIHWNTCQYLTFTSYTILQSETKQCCEAFPFFFFSFSFFYINATVLFNVNPTILFGAQAQFLIMLPCVSGKGNVTLFSI